MMLLLEKKPTRSNFFGEFTTKSSTAPEKQTFFFSKLFSLPLGHVISEQHSKSQEFAFAVS